MDMIADIFNFAKCVRYFGEVRSVSAHTPGSLVLRRSALACPFSKGASKSCDNNFVSDVGELLPERAARSRVRRGGARVPRRACFCRCGDAASGLQPSVAERFEADDRASARFVACDRRARGPCLGREGRFCRADRSDQHPERFVRRDVAGGRGVADPSGISGDRRQPVPHDARYSVSLHRQGGPNMRILPPRRCWPRPTATNIWSASPEISPNTVGSATKVIRPANIAWRSVVTGLRLTTG